MKNNILNSVRNFKFAMATCTALLLAGWSSDAKAATQYWNQAGTTGTWTSANWGTSASGPFTGAWVASNDVVFGGSVAAAATFATTTVGNITVNTDTTVTTAGTLTFKTGGSTVDVAAGKTLTWATQNWTTAAAQIITKSGTGTWNIGAQGNALAAGSSFTLGAGTVIVGGNNSFGGTSSALNINGGTIQSSGTRAYANSAVTIGGNFENSGTGNATWSGTVALGSATRTINNATTSGSRSYTGVISGAAGTGLTFTGTGAGQTYIGNTANTFSGPITITGSEVIFNDNGAMGATTSITIDGGRLTIGTTSSGSAITTGTIASNRNIFVGSTAGTSISIGGATGVTTYNGVIANKSGSTGLLAKQGSGALVLGGVSTYSGDTAINNGILRLTTGNDRLPTGTVVSLGQAASSNLGAFDLNGRNQQIAGLASTTGNNSSANKNTVTSATAATLDINVAEGTTRSYGAGTTQNSGAITGLLALTKSGLGTQVLGDANTYSGTTTVNAGTLVVNGSLLNSGSVVVNQNGFLGGSGSVGALTVATGGTLTPGNSPGLLTAASATFQSGSNLNWEIFNAVGTAGVEWDLLSVTGNLNVAALSSGAMNLVLKSLSALPDTVGALAGFNSNDNYSWTFARAASITGATGDLTFGQDVTSLFSINGTSFNLGTAPTSDWKVMTGTETVGGTTYQTLNLMAVPEPSAQSLLAFGMAALVAVRSLRKKNS